MNKQRLYHYTGCGLPNVWLRNGFIVRDTEYGKAVAIHDVNGLHRAIGLYFVDRKPVLSGTEVRYLRKELDLTQSRLAQFLGVSENSIRGWENQRARISRPAERFLRILYREHVVGDGNVRALVDRLADLDRSHVRKLELEDTESGWRAAA
jgi:putative transcriptional regulator